MAAWISNSFLNHKVKQPQKSNFISSSTGSCSTEHCSSNNRNPYQVSFAVRDRCILTLRKDKAKLGKIMVTISNSCLLFGPQNMFEFFTRWLTCALLSFSLENLASICASGLFNYFYRFSVVCPISSLSPYVEALSLMSRSEVRFKAFFY